MSENTIILRKEYKVAGVPIWVEVQGSEDTIFNTAIDTKDGELAKKGTVKKPSKLYKKLDNAFTSYFKDPNYALSKLPISHLNDDTKSNSAAIEYLKTIPTGKTRSYEQQAKAVQKKCKNKFSARNAGNANRQNLFPLIIPCHRVIRKDGDIGGFMGSTKSAARQLKRALLVHEKAINP